MSRLLFALFILAIVCLKLCIENHDENTTEYPIYCPGVTDNRKINICSRTAPNMPIIICPQDIPLMPTLP